MRGRIGGMLMNNRSSTPKIIIGRNNTKLLSSSSWCSYSGNGNGNGNGGGGRGSGSGSCNSKLYNFVAGKTDCNDHHQPSGLGHGRGKAVTFVAPEPPPHQSGLSRGRGAPIQHPGPLDHEAPPSQPRHLIRDNDLPDSIFSVLPGTGRGQPLSNPSSHAIPKEENRHLRARHPPPPGPDTASPPTPKLSREDATKKAVSILSKGDDASADGGSHRSRQKGAKDKDDSDDEVNDNEFDDAVFLGNDADGEKFAHKLGPTLMADVTEAFDDMSFDVLPDLKFDDHIDKFDANLKIELEPEYLMGDFDTNPEIDEKPPIPLAEALQKMKPFLMACEGLQTQEEWEEAVKSTMDDFPLMKEIVDHYCGPDRVTAKQQHEELERVAKTIPPNVPNSVKRFTDQAVLSLQSNPGWGFHRKWQFMDKLVDEVSKSQN